jgi:5'-nucleotidase
MKDKRISNPKPGPASEQPRERAIHQIVPDFSRRRALGYLIAAPFLSLPRRARSATKTRITILHTNDTHSRMEPFAAGRYKGRGGVAARSAIVKRVRSMSQNTLLLDAGDVFQGTPYFNEYLGELDIRMMAAMGYDAVALGNHDFDAGVEQLAKNLLHKSKMKVLNSNYAVDPGSPIHSEVAKHWILDRGDVRIGLFGLGIAFHGLVNPKLHPGVSYEDPRTAAQREVAFLKSEGCSLIIAMSHLGYSGYRGEVGDQDWPRHIPGVNYVVGGHTHTFLKRPTVVRHPSGWETLVMQVGHSGLNLGHAQFDVDANGRVDARSSLPVGVGGRAIC